MTHGSFQNKDKALYKATIYIYIYIDIVIHRQDCFVLSELFSVARHAGHSKSGSKPVKVYVRLSFKPVGHPSGLRWLGEF